MTRTHRDLAAWQEAVDLVTEVHRATAGFPASEVFGLTAQIRRAAASVAADVAEGAARGSRKEFAQFLTIARGSLSELETLLLVAANVEHLGAESHHHLQAALDRVAALLNGLLANVKKRIAST